MKEPLYNGFVDNIFRIERRGDKASPSLLRVYPLVFLLWVLAEVWNGGSIVHLNLISNCDAGVKILYPLDFGVWGLFFRTFGGCINVCVIIFSQILLTINSGV